MNAPGPLSGPLWAVLGRLGVFVGGSGLSWIRSWVLCWRSWAALEACVGGLGRSRGLCWRSCAALGAYVGGLGPLLGALLAVLGRLGPKNAKNIATLKMCLFLERERDLRPGGRS